MLRNFKSVSTWFHVGNGYLFTKAPRMHSGLRIVASTACSTNVLTGPTAVATVSKAIPVAIYLSLRDCRDHTT